jgi:hypothetical protein
MLVALHEAAVAATALKVTVLFPWLAPKPVPVIVIAVPAEPDVGLRVLITGGMFMVSVTVCVAVV